MSSAVFGPGRPVAAHKAICELEAAQVEWEAAFWGPREDAVWARLQAAKADRANYTEYADAAAALARI